MSDNQHDSDVNIAPQETLKTPKKSINNGKFRNKSPNINVNAKDHNPNLNNASNEKLGQPEESLLEFGFGDPENARKKPVLKAKVKKQVENEYEVPDSKDERIIDSRKSMTDFEQPKVRNSSIIEKVKGSIDKNPRPLKVDSTKSAPNNDNNDPDKNENLLMDEIHSNKIDHKNLTHQTKDNDANTEPNNNSNIVNDIKLDVDSMKKIVKNNLLDEIPIGGSQKGAYNLDNLEELEKAYVPSNKNKKMIKKPVTETIEKVELIDEKPIGGSKTGGYDLDNLDQIQDNYKPSAIRKMPVKPNHDEEIIDEKPEENNKTNRNDFDNLEQINDNDNLSSKTKVPVKTSLIQGALDEKPVGGKSGGYDLDNLDQIQDNYKPSGKSKVTPKPNPVPDALDEKPVGGSKTGGYDLDNLEQVKDTYKPSGKTKVIVKSNPDQEVINEKLVGGSKTGGYDLDNLDQIQDNYKPSGKTKAPVKANPVQDILDEKPVGGGKTGGYDLDNLDQIQDTYKPSGKARPQPKISQPPKENLDEKPIATTKNGGYDLDNLDQIQDTYKPSGKSRPIAKIAQVNKEEVEEIPIGNNKTGGYDLDNLDKIQDTYKPSAKAKKPVSKPDDETAHQEVSPNTTNPVEEQQIGGKGYNLDDPNAFPTGQQAPADTGDETLEMKMKSANFGTRLASFDEIMKWTDSEVTPDYFIKNLHLTIKEKHPQVLDKVFSATESLIDSSKGDWSLLDFKKFLLNFHEHAMGNVKGDSKQHLNDFTIKFWDFYSNKDQFMEELKGLLATIKMKVQISALQTIETLLKAEKLEQMKYLKPFMGELEKLLPSRTAAVKKAAMAVYREAFLWMADGLKAFLTNLKQPQMDDLNKLFAGVDKAEMKAFTKKADGKKGKAMDAYEIADEAELPKRFQEDAWAEKVMEQQKWKDKKEMLDELIAELNKIPKLNPKTNTHHFVTLARKLFSENNIMVQVTMCKVLAKLATSLRKAFVQIEKMLFSNLIVKLKEKNKSLTEEIATTIEAFYVALPFEDTIEDYKENLKEKNTDKKQNILKIILNAIEKLEKIKNDNTAANVCRMVLGLIDENDNVVRDLASQVIAKLKDQFPDKITPMLSDLNSQKLSKINKHSSIQVAESTEPANDGNADDDDKDKKKKDGKRKNLASMTKDKAQMIAEIRENLFSNKTVKLSDTKNFSKYLETNLRNLSELTKDFKEVSTNQQKEIFILIDEIANKVEKTAFMDDSRKVLALFYIEQTLSKYNEELINSLDNFLNHPNKILTHKIFINDILDVISRRNIKVSKDLLNLITRLMEKEVAANNNVASIPHKFFVEFLKTHFATGTIQTSIKSLIINFMRTIGKKYGSKALTEYPANLVKEYEQYNAEIQKSFTKMMEKLADKNIERKKTAMNELATTNEASKLVLYWSIPEFVSFLRRSLITESNIQMYEMLIKSLKNYLELNKTSPADFSFKIYLSVFSLVMQQYYDRVDSAQTYNPEKFAIIEDIFARTVGELSAGKILTEMLTDINTFTYKEQICNFYMQFAAEIDTTVGFMEYIVALINSKHYNSEIKQLVDNVLLILKTANNEELILKGNENKIVRDIWQKNEEDVLFDENFAKGNKIFEDISLFNSVKMFMQNNLGFDEAIFFTKNIDSVVITEFDDQVKIKLAYFYLKSIENVPSVAETIYCQLKRVNISNIDNTGLLLIIKILINLLKNYLYASNDNFYQDVKSFFISIVQDIHLTIEELFRILDLNGLEIGFITRVLNNVEATSKTSVANIYGSEEALGQYTTTQKNYGNIKDTSVIVENYGNRDPDATSLLNDKRGVTGNKNHRNSRAIPPIEDDYVNQYNREVSVNIPSPRSHASKNSSRKNVYINQLSKNDNSILNNFTKDVAMESKLMLEQMFKCMLSFDLMEFQKASDYFLEMCKTKKQDQLKFLISNGNDIVKVFTEVLSSVFAEGINYDLERSDYEMIFTPLQNLCEIDGFLEMLEQDTLNIFVEQDLTRLVESNVEKTKLDASNIDKDKSELAGYVVKGFNCIMLRIIDHSEINALFYALFSVIFNTKDTITHTTTKDINNLAFKCLVRMTRNLKNVISKVDPRIVIRLIYQYIELFGLKDSAAIGTKTVKTILNELVTRSKPDFIWTCYKEALNGNQEPNISKWIKIILSKMNNEQTSNRNNEAERKLMELIEMINSQNKVTQLPFFNEQFINIMKENNSIDFSNYAGYFSNKSYFDYFNAEIRKSKDERDGFDDNMSVSRNSVNTQKSTAKKNIDDYLNKSDVYEAKDYYKKLDSMKNRFKK